MPAQIHGNTRLEVGWTVGAARDPASALAVLTFVKLVLDPGPAQLGPERRHAGRATSGLLYASAERKLPPNGKSLEHHR